MTAICCYRPSKRRGPFDFTGSCLSSFTSAAPELNEPKKKIKKKKTELKRKSSFNCAGYFRLLSTFRTFHRRCKVLMSKAKTRAGGEKQHCWLGKSNQINEILQIILHKICASCEMFFRDLRRVGGSKLSFCRTTALIYTKAKKRRIFMLN